MKKLIANMTGLLLLLGITACATPVVKPVERGAADLSKIDGGYYADAIAALRRRDYAEALELLQAARAERLDDVRVLNAFGVVYDKLGRFDLSARYYAQARALDPGSQIVAQNMAYSARLQGQEAVAAQTLALPAAPAQPTLSAAASTAATSLLVLPAPHARSRVRLHLVDATGEANGASLARIRLTQLGWSTPPSRARLPRRWSSKIVYPHSRMGAALALARSLPARVRLVECRSPCRTLRLVVGADLTAWRPAAGRSLAVHSATVTASLHARSRRLFGTPDPNESPKQSRGV